MMRSGVYRGLMAKEDLKDLGFRKENDELLADRVDKIGEKEREWSALHGSD